MIKSANTLAAAACAVTLWAALMSMTGAALGQVDMGPDPDSTPGAGQNRDLPLPPPGDEPLFEADPRFDPHGVPREDPEPAPLPKPEAKPVEPPAPNPAIREKGEPGMMGLPFPKSPEETEKTLESLYAFLATEPDHRRAGEIGAAIERLWRLEGGDTVNLLIDRAEDFSSKMQQEKALSLMDAAVDLAPDYAEAWSHRAYVYYRMNNYSAALGDLRRAIALQPNHFRALDGMAKILDLLGEKKAALQAYEQLLKIHPEIEGGKPAAEDLKKAVEGQGI